MSDPFKFDVKPRSGALADAADRLERVASVVKDQQLQRIQSGGVRRPESEAYVSSPEEAWSKKYMIQCVGPVCTVRPTDEGALLLPRFQPEPKAEAQMPAAIQQAPSASVLPSMASPAADHPPFVGPQVPAHSAPAAQMAEIVRVLAETPPPKPARRGAKVQAEPIGLAIGKNVRKRSLLGRMFGR
ncbi:MAG: hypothetical protein JOZ72_03810 [Alphaproteobacteria bacterium]|nr:hypothetical protein [Alphaproteobacteria bacterium]